MADNKTSTLEDQIVTEIESLQEQSQARLSALAQGDAVWANLQGQIVALNSTLGKLRDDEKPISEGVEGESSD